MKKFLLILVVLAVLGCGVIITSLNGLVAMEESVKATWSQVLNQYQRRTDLIPNLVEAVKGYAAHEQETLNAVIEARAKATQTVVTGDTLANPAAVQNFMANQAGLTGALSRLMAIAENYPDLKANQNFLALQSQLEGTENRISVARRDYIDMVRAFNTKLRSIPTAWIANTFGNFTVMPTFEIEESAQAVPQVSFSK